MGIPRRINPKNLYDQTAKPLESQHIWFLHTVMTQCFLPYKDPEKDTWERHNGDFSITLVAGHVRDPRSDTLTRRVGLPYGAKPRLFQSYICMQAVKNQSAIIPIEGSMSEMMEALGFAVTGASTEPSTHLRSRLLASRPAIFPSSGPAPKVLTAM